MARRADGTVLLTCGHALGPVTARTTDWLEHWARHRPDAPFLIARDGAGWQELSYRQALADSRALAAWMLERGVAPGQRVAILSGNGIDHARVVLAAQLAGIIAVPLAEQYALVPEARARLDHVIRKTRPALLFVDEPARFSAALTAPGLRDIPVLAGTGSGAPRPVATVEQALQTRPGAALEAAHAAVGPDTVAKILFTSGSTAMPKGVPTTQRMMCVNQAQIATLMPFLADRPPKIVDWLPWNHVFGGSHNFNLVLAHGGTLVIDPGKPVEPLFGETLKTLADHVGTLAFNVPAGWALLADAMEADSALRDRFFADLDLLFYAGAALPPALWERLRALALAATGQVPLMTSSWGMTETAPAALMVHQPIDRAGVIGVPVPEGEALLLPIGDAGDGRFELRFRGPNVMTGYWDDPERTAAAFDDEGFLITGDAVRFVDPGAPEKGLAFDGRVGEDFKLLSGVWVHATNVRAAALAALDGLAQDVVVTGHDRADIGILIFPYPQLLTAPGYDDTNHDGAVAGGRLERQVRSALQKLARQATGSSNRIARAMILADPPSVRAHEVTAKGNLNVARVLEERAHLVARLYDDDDPATIRV